MKIQQIDVFRVDYELIADEYNWSRGQTVTSMNSTVCKVTTDEGLVGWGEVCPLGSSYMDSYPGGLAAGIEELGPHLIGHDPTDLLVINDTMDSAMWGHNYVKTLIDIACWDIFGQASGQPVCKLLGGKFVDDYPLYRPISMHSPQKMAEIIQGYMAEGYHRFQLKVGADPFEDIERIKACRAVMGETDILVADANTGWNKRDAIRVANGVADVDVYYEAPCPTLEESLSVRRRTNLPFIIDELITGVDAFLTAWKQDAMDGINIKLSRVGGLTRAKQIRDLAQSCGLSITMEDGHGGDVTTTAVCHLVASTKPQAYFTSSDQNSYNKLRIAPDAPFRDNGRLTVPDKPGLGITVDESVLGKPVVTVK